MDMSVIMIFGEKVTFILPNERNFNFTSKWPKNEYCKWLNTTRGKEKSIL